MNFDWDNASQEERLNYLRREIGNIWLHLQGDIHDRKALLGRIDALERRMEALERRIVAK